MKPAKVAAIVVAAGSSRRMAGVDKIFAPVAGKPLLAHSVDILQRCPSVDQVVIVLGQDKLEEGRRLAQEHNWSKVVAICPGGRRRQDSVREGLERVSGCEWVVIHDGARPCLSVDLVERGIEEARHSGAAIAAIPVQDTIKVVSSEGLVEDTPYRRELWAAQTPQVFRIDIIREAHQKASSEVTDDASLVEQLGYKVKVYPGSPTNIKVTTPEDLSFAETILRDRARKSSIS